MLLWGYIPKTFEMRARITRKSSGYAKDDTGRDPRTTNHKYQGGLNDY